MKTRRDGATCVRVDGPFGTASRRTDWDEVPEWIGDLSDDDGDSIGTIWRFDTFDAAFEWGEAEASKTGLEFCCEASPAWS